MLQRNVVVAQRVQSSFSSSRPLKREAALQARQFVSSEYRACCAVLLVGLVLGEAAIVAVCVDVKTGDTNTQDHNIKQSRDSTTTIQSLLFRSLDAYDYHLSEHSRTQHALNPPQPEPEARVGNTRYPIQHLRNLERLHLS